VQSRRKTGNRSTFCQPAFQEHLELFSSFSRPSRSESRLMSGEMANQRSAIAAVTGRTILNSCSAEVTKRAADSMAPKKTTSSMRRWHCRTPEIFMMRDGKDGVVTRGGPGGDICRIYHFLPPSPLARPLYQHEAIVSCEGNALVRRTMDDKQEHGGGGGARPAVCGVAHARRRATWLTAGLSLAGSPCTRPA
jgi:hypothetical protein